VHGMGRRRMNTPGHWIGWWGLSLGLRHAEGTVMTSGPTTSVRTGQPDPNLPPWDQPEGRSYR
jgi:hypothetical protein